LNSPPKADIGAQICCDAQRGIFDRTKASFVTPSRAKSLPSGIIEVACDGEGNLDESVCASVAGVPLPAIAKLLNFSFAFGF